MQLGMRHKRRDESVSIRPKLMRPSRSPHYWYDEALDKNPREDTADPHDNLRREVTGDKCDEEGGNQGNVCPRR